MSYSARITKNFEDITRDKGYSARSTKKEWYSTRSTFKLII